LKHILIILSLLYSSLLVAQEQAWVFFTEKPDWETRIETPTDFLTTKAITRKEKYNIEIDARDLPLEEDYVNEIKLATGITYLASSKWFNGVFVEGLQTDIEALTTLTYVDSVYFMDRSLNASERPATSSKPSKIDHEKFTEETTIEYGSTTTQIEQINVDGLHDLGFTGEGMTIAVMDNGFVNVDTIEAFDRARENNLLLGGYDFEDKTDDIYAHTGSHGTNVLSTMLGYIENSFAGTAIDAQYYLFRTEVDASETPKEEAYWIAAAEMADSLGVDIINTSLGYSTFQDAKYNYATSDMDGETAFISQAASIALEKGMLPVTSAGNSGSSSWGIITAPADSPGTLAIGAVNYLGNVASFSSRGYSADGRVKPDVMAMGVTSSVISSSGSIATSNGTSFSGPITCGAVACLWQSLPDYAPTEIMEAVRESGHIYATPNQDYGYGIPNFLAAYNLLSNENFEYITQYSLLENPVSDSIQLNFPFETTNTDYRIFDITGQLSLNGNCSTNETIDVNNLSEGIYFLQLEDVQNLIKFVKN